MEQLNGKDVFEKERPTIFLFPKCCLKITIYIYFIKVLCELCSLSYVLMSVLFLSCFIHSFIFNMQEQNNDLFQDLEYEAKWSSGYTQSKQKWNFRDQITLNIFHPRPRKAFVQNLNLLNGRLSCYLVCENVTWYTRKSQPKHPWECWFFIHFLQLSKCYNNQMKGFCFVFYT